MKSKDEKSVENRDLPRLAEEQNHCDHDFHMLDLGTGHYDYYVCMKCGLDRKDLEN